MLLCYWLCYWLCPVCFVFLGSMCVCYSQPLKDRLELIYTLVLVHKGVCAIYCWVFNECTTPTVFCFLFLSLFLCVCFYLECIVIWIFSLSADCSKTFRVSLGRDQPPQKARQLHPLFIPIGHCTHRHVMQSYTHTHQSPYKFSVWEGHTCSSYLCIQNTDTQIQMRSLYPHAGYYISGVPTAC